jgi:hypothetical protein
VPRIAEIFDWDPEEAGSRFTTRPAFALTLPEEEWTDRGEGGPRAALRHNIGDWVLEEQEDLGRGEPVDSTYGRGASGIAVALEFVGLAALTGVISVSAGMAWRRLLERVGRSLQDDERPRHVLVSRGGAAYLAAAEVGERFGEQGELIVEAVEEPSSIAGHEVSELSYTGIEPWIVLLRRDETLRRYVVVVAPDGEIDGALQTPMREGEPGYLLPPPERVRPPQRRRWWQRRG